MVKAYARTSSGTVGLLHGTSSRAHASAPAPFLAMQLVVKYQNYSRVLSFFMPHPTGIDPGFISRYHKQVHSATTHISLNMVLT